MNNDEPVRSVVRHWRPIAAAVLSVLAAAVITFACLSGPSSAAPTSDPSVSGVDPGASGGHAGAHRVHQR